MQSEQYVVGDFYRDWLSCELELHDLGSTVSYAAQLHDAMKSRKQSLMSNNAFIAALYLDPRFNFRGSLMLSPQQKVNAENHLIKTYENMLRMESSENSMSSSPQNLNLQYSECLPSTSSNSFSRLEKYICEDMEETSSDVEVVQNLRQKLSVFANGRKFSLDTDILSYWKTFPSDKHLRKLAEVVLAVPATQVSVERAFSALSLTLKKHRSKLNDATLNNILITKLNFDLLYFRDNDMHDISSH
ncbi:PREDICTED: uncharacterized protein LOC108360849 [Rhagoletis zephyria]|uniref:uncharacterized protein LOC108360849 n=1 Tax=Rhagoletis zephyria TaxID=28612 RepID=UPI0008114903|nr:PREDICTED: uncharacterized protein LOC108360849 [Rhagoletis zephyria]